jgi:hypothetical protein
MYSRRHTLTLQKSSSSTQKLYKEAYIQACRAIQFDTNAKYPEAKEAYAIVIKVKNNEYNPIPTFFNSLSALEFS